MDDTAQLDCMLARDLPALADHIRNGDKVNVCPDHAAELRAMVAAE